MLALLVPLAMTVIGNNGKFGDTPNSIVPAFAFVVASRNASKPKYFLIVHSFSLRSGRMSVGVQSDPTGVSRDPTGLGRGSAQEWPLG
jgi:hypothetical protein